MFTINSFDPTHLTLVGEPADTLGEFPVSVAYSPNLKTGQSEHLNLSAGHSQFTHLSCADTTQLVSSILVLSEA